MYTFLTKLKSRKFNKNSMKILSCRQKLLKEFENDHPLEIDDHRLVASWSFGGGFNCRSSFISKTNRFMTSHQTI